MRKILFFRNTSKTKRWGWGRLPVRQTLIWAGPLFVLLQPKRKVSQ